MHMPGCVRACVLLGAAPRGCGLGGGDCCPFGGGGAVHWGCHWGCQKTGRHRMSGALERRRRAHISVTICCAPPVGGQRSKRAGSNSLASLYRSRKARQGREDGSCQSAGGPLVAGQLAGGRGHMRALLAAVHGKRGRRQRGRRARGCGRLLPHLCSPARRRFCRRAAGRGARRSGDRGGEREGLLVFF